MRFKDLVGMGEDDLCKNRRDPICKADGVELIESRNTAIVQEEIENCQSSSTCLDPAELEYYARLLRLLQ
jgi:hypothetical protein